MDVMAIASIGMQGDLARMESISHNTANALTPGFKRQIPLTAGFSAQLNVAQNARHLQLQTQADNGVKISIDPAAGAMRPSANPQDVTIEGLSFFEIITPTGTAYTRQGSLRVDAQGRLVTGQDMPVMGQAGEIRVTNTPFTVAKNGDVTQDGRVVGRLKLVSFAQPHRLLAMGAGVYGAGDAQPQQTQGEASLRVGFLEGSNVSTPQEMVRMTETVRHFESLQKLVQGYDEMLEKSIRKLGDF
jgi:flagellar basal body rod protein FlgG